VTRSSDQGWSALLSSATHWRGRWLRPVGCGRPRARLAAKARPAKAREIAANPHPGQVHSPCRWPRGRGRPRVARPTPPQDGCALAARGPGAASGTPPGHTLPSPPECRHARPGWAGASRRAWPLHGRRERGGAWRSACHGQGRACATGGAPLPKRCADQWGEGAGRWISRQELTTIVLPPHLLDDQ